MLLKLNYEEMTKSLSLLGKVISPKGIQEDLKVVNLFIKDNKIKMAVTDGRIFCIRTLEGEYDLEGESVEDSYFAIYVKEISDILDKFKGLQRTKVESVEIYVKEFGIIVTVNEVAKDENSADAHLYTQATRFKIVKEKVKRILINEIPSLVVADNGIEVNSEDLKLYVDYLYSPICKPKQLTLVHFKDDKVYAILGNVWGVVMNNKLPDLFRGFSLTPQAVGFLKEVIGQAEKFRISKELITNKDNLTGEDRVVGVILTLEVGDYVVKIKASDETSKATTEPFTPAPANLIKIDKFYLMDALKRVAPKDNVFISVDIEDGVAELELTTLKTRQRVPVKSAVGNGKFHFTLLPEHVNNVIFSHITKSPDGKSLDDVYLGFKSGTDTSVIELTCYDDTGYWTTKYPRVAVREAPKLDF